MKEYEGIGGRRRDFNSIPQRIHDEDIENKVYDIPLPKRHRIREFSVLWWIIFVGCISGATTLIVNLIGMLAE